MGVTGYYMRLKTTVRFARRRNDFQKEKGRKVVVSPFVNANARAPDFFATHKTASERPALNTGAISNQVRTSLVV